MHNDQHRLIWQNCSFVALILVLTEMYYSAGLQFAIS